MKDLEYSPVSSPAVASFLVAIVGLVGFFIPEFALLGVIGAALGVVSLRGLVHYQLRGLSFAVAGILLSALGALGAPAWQCWQFSQEALPGHERLRFAELDPLVKSEVGTPSDSWVGRNVCLKGYALPLHGGSAPTSFLLSPDGGDGGFGAPMYGVVVELGGFNALENAWWNAPIAVSGTLVLQEGETTNKGLARFKLIRPTIRKAQTRYDLAMRTSRGPC